MADGKIVITTDIETQKAEAKLKKLNEKVRQLQRSLNSKTAKRDDISESLKKSAADAEATRQRVAELKREYEELQAIKERVSQGGSISTSREFELLNNETSITNEYRKQESILEKQDGLVAKLNRQLQDANASVADADEKLRNAQDELREVTRQLEEAAAPSRDVNLNLEGAAESVKRLNKRIAGLMKRVFVFTVITSALRSVKEWFSKVIKTDSELTGRLAELKGAFLTLAQPILNVVIPALSTLVSMLTKVVSAAASVISLLFGSTASNSADQAESLYKEAEALDSVGKSAGEAEKQLASFDTINKLSDSSGGSSSSDSIIPDFSKVKDFKLPDWLEDFLTKLKITIDDVLFDWKDLTGEQIAKKAIAGLTTLCGGVAGFMIGGVPGALVGSLLGLALGLVIDTLTFDNDGVISKQEIAKMVILAIGAITGGVLGFKVGGLKGALIGATIGMSLTAVVNSLLFDDNSNLSRTEINNMMRTVLIGALGGVVGFAVGGALGGLIGLSIGVVLSLVISKVSLNAEQAALDEYSKTAFAQQVQEVANQVAERTDIVVDLKARVDSITGTIDDATLANFDLAQQLVNEIFELDAEDNKTAEQVAVLVEKVEMLNSLGLGDLGLEYDELTGHVTRTKDEIEATISAIKRQYELEAMKDAYIEAYQAHAESAYALKEAEEDLTASRENAKTAANELATANDNLADAQTRLDEAQQKLYSDGVWIGTDEWEYWAGEVEQASKDVALWSKKVDTARIACEDANAVLTQSVSNYNGLISVYDETGKKVEYFSGQIDDLVGNLDKQEEATEDGKNVMGGYAAGIEQGKNKAQEAILKASRDILRDERRYNEIASPSGLYKGEGEYLMAGLAEGITGNAYRPIDAMKAVVNSLAEVVERGINNIVDKYNGVALQLNAQAADTNVRASALSRVSIPRLAQGAVIPANREFLAVLGDQKYGTNIETPLPTMIKAFKQAMSEMNFNGNNEAVLELDGVQFGKLVYRYNRSESNRIGVNLAGG